MAREQTHCCLLLSDMADERIAAIIRRMKRSRAENGTEQRDSPILALKRVSVERDEQRILRRLTWSVCKGENWAVLGANGSGKSVLASVIAGDCACSGDIDYNFGADVPDPCELIATVSFRLHSLFVAQPDSYYQSRWYPGEEEITLTAGQILRSIAGRSAAATKHLQQTVRFLEINTLLDRQTLHLSTGEMRRLLIARSLLMRPVLLVLDEPFIGLDVAGRARLMRILERLMRRGQQILLMSARPDELPRGITHALWLRRGRIIESGPLDRRSFNRACTKTFGKARRKTPAVSCPRKQVRHRVSLLTMNQVTLQAGEVRLLTDFSWTVRPEERWAVAGPNGAGKTTLLSLLVGDHPQAFAQDVRLFGHRRGEGYTLWQLKAKIGWASPDIALHFGNLTSTFEFVCTGFFETLGLYRDCSRSQAEAARKWLRFFGLSAVADRPFRLLSDGQQRLAMIARALVKSPRLLVLDEPCQGLDAASRERVLGAIEAVCKRQRTTLIMVTHYESELPVGITHRLELRRGRSPRVKVLSPK